MARYEILEEYVESQGQDIEQGRPVIVEIRNSDTFERLIVKALIGQPAQPIAGGDHLVVKNLAENVVSDQWTIKVIEELDPEAVGSTAQSAFRKNAPDGS